MYGGPFYHDRIRKLSKFIIDTFGYTWFRDKNILDLGGGHGDIGSSLYRLGAKVIVIDAKRESLKIAAKKYPGIRTQLSDLDKEWTFRNLDMILDLDLTCHLKNWQTHLTNACNSCNHIIVETAVSDSDDPTFCVLVSESQDDDQSYNGHGSRPSAAAIETIFTNTGMEFKRYDLEEFNCGKRVYNWEVKNTKGHDDSRRRLWIATRTKPSTQSLLSLVSNVPLTPGQTLQKSQVYIDPNANLPPRFAPGPYFVPTPDQFVPPTPTSPPFIVPPIPAGPKMRLFFNYYQGSNPERQKELDLALQKNIENPYFDLIILDSAERPTFNFFFNAINQLAGPDDISIFCNSDIFFDQTIQLAKNIGPKEVYALTRYDWINENDHRLFKYEDGRPRLDSQDAWLVRGQVVGVDGNFTLGQLGCDNKIAHLFKQAGYKVSNPAKSIKILHVHNSGIRTYSEKERLHGPYLFVEITGLPA